MVSSSELYEPAAIIPTLIPIIPKVRMVANSCLPLESKKKTPKATTRNCNAVNAP